MGIISKTFWISAAAVAGVYLSSKEGAETRKKIKKHLENFTPVVKDLLDKTEVLLDSTQELKSDELRANIEKRIDKVKKSLANIDSKKVSEQTTSIVQKASKQIRELRMQLNTNEKEETGKDNNKLNTLKSKSIDELKEIAKKYKVQVQPKDLKEDIINKLKPYYEKSTKSKTDTIKIKTPNSKKTNAKKVSSKKNKSKKVDVKKIEHKKVKAKIIEHKKVKAKKNEPKNVDTIIMKNIKKEKVENK